MAIFNPSVPDTQDPNWLGWSKPISVTPSDTSTGVALSSAAGVAGDALKLADTATKSVLEDQIYDSAKAEQQRRQDELNNTYDMVRGMPTAQAGSLLATDGSSNVPPALANLPSRVGIIDDARANGKISQTDYAMRLDALAKDFRARYPGYKELVDQTFQKVTGIDPANKMIESRIQDINTFVTNSNTEKNKAWAYVTNEAVRDTPEGIDAAQKLQAGQITPAQAIASVAPALQRKYAHDQKLQAGAEFKNDNEIQSNIYTSAANTYATGEVAASMNKIVLQNGQSFQTWIAAHPPGAPTPVDPQEQIQTAQVLNAAKNTQYSALWSHFANDGGTNPDGSLRRSTLETIGDQKLKELLNTTLTPYDNQIAAINSKDIGTVYTNAIRLDQKSKGAELGLLETNSKLWTTKSLQGIAGPNWSSSLIKYGLGLTLTQDELAKLTETSEGFITQNGKVNPTTGVPAPVTPKGVYNAIDQKNKDPNAAATPSTPNLNKAVADLPTRIITDPKVTDTAKLNAARGAFGPENQGEIGLIKGAQNKTDVFTNRTSTKMTDEIWRLNQQQPGVWAGYTKWATNEFAHEMYAKDITMLRFVQDNPNIKITWDTENHQLGIVTGDQVQSMNPSKTKSLFSGAMPDDQTRYGSITVDQRINDARAAVTRINQGLQSINYMFQKEGKDPDVYTRSLLLGLGVGPSKVNDTLRMNGAAIPYNEENTSPSGTLDQWLKNPSSSTFTRPPIRNLSDDKILGMDVQDIPEGMSARDFLQKLKNQGR